MMVGMKTTPEGCVAVEVDVTIECMKLMRRAKEAWGEFDVPPKVPEMLAFMCLMCGLVVVCCFASERVAANHRAATAQLRKEMQPKPRQMVDPSGRLVDKPVGNL
jgi:hypothetical protein